MVFDLKIRADGKLYWIHVVRVHLDLRAEQFEVTSGKKTILIESNRPLFRNRGMKWAKPDWKVIEGDIQNPATLPVIFSAILEAVENAPLSKS